MVKKIAFGLTAAASIVEAFAWACYGVGLAPEPPHLSAGTETMAFVCAAFFMIDGCKPETPAKPPSR